MALIAAAAPEMVVMHGMPCCTVKARMRPSSVRGPRPDVPIGEQCTRPYPCPFFDRCWPTPPRHHVSTLYTMPRREALTLEPSPPAASPRR